MKRFILFFTLCLNHIVYPEGFVAGTPVKTPNGYIPIEQIQTGDQVISREDKWDGDCRTGTVIQVIRQYTDTLVRVTIDDESFFTTPDQFFISTLFPNKALYDGTSDTEWIAVTNLKGGERLPNTVEYSTISSIELIDACAEIYTLSVAKYGNFCVSTHDIFAHNFVAAVAVAGPPAAPFLIAAAPAIGAITVCTAVGYGAYRIWQNANRGRRSSKMPDVLRRPHDPTYVPPHTQDNPSKNSDGSGYEVLVINNESEDSDIPHDQSPKISSSCGGGNGQPPWDPDDPKDPWKKGRFWQNRRLPREHIFPTMKSYEQARNKALEIMGKVDFAKSKPIIGKFGACKGKVVGRTWHNGAVTMRLDYDAIKGPHINVTDYRMGKGSSGTTVAIPFKGTEATVKALLKHLQ